MGDFADRADEDQEPGPGFQVRAPFGVSGVKGARTWEPPGSCFASRVTAESWRGRMSKEHNLSRLGDLLKPAQLARLSCIAARLYEREPVSPLALVPSVVEGDTGETFEPFLLDP